MDFLLYLNWIENNMVPRYKDYLKQSIVGLKEEYFNIGHAERWLEGVRSAEELWNLKVSLVEETGDTHMNREFPLENSQCYTWNKPCSYIPICWKDQPIETLIQEGKLIERVPNHLVELNKGE
jgi:hypothetical protein